MWTVEANFETLWWNLGFFNTSEVCYRRPAHKNFITAISTRPREGKFVITDGLVNIKNSEKKIMLILSGSITSVHMTKARIWTRISARVGIIFILTLSLSSRLIDVKF